MLRLKQQLELERCPHCGVDRPNLTQTARFETNDHRGANPRVWAAAPAGAVMLTASAVDAMLKAKGYEQGSLYNRIDKAAADHVITTDMAAWAHEVRLDANDQRHADKAASLPTAEDAKHAIDFAMALGQFMFVLPSRVRRGIQEAKKS